MFSKYFLVNSLELLRQTIILSVNIFFSFPVFRTLIISSCHILGELATLCSPFCNGSIFFFISHVTFNNTEIRLKKPLVHCNYPQIYLFWFSLSCLAHLSFWPDIILFLHQDVFALVLEEEVCKQNILLVFFKLKMALLHFHFWRIYLLGIESLVNSFYFFLLL